MKFYYNTSFTLPKQSQRFWDCFGRKKFYHNNSQRNMVSHLYKSTVRAIVVILMSVYVIPDIDKKLVGWLVVLGLMAL